MTTKTDTDAVDANGIGASGSTADVVQLHAGASAAGALIKKLDAYVSLSAADRAALMSINGVSRLIEAGSDILRDNSEPNGTYVVVEGYACRYKVRSDGARQITSFLVPGDFCDVDVALGTMNHSIGTFSACTVMKIPRDTFNTLSLGHPAIAQALRLARLVDEATLREWLMNIGRRSAEERIAHLFCELLIRLEAVGLAQDNSFRFPLTQFDLGDTVGLSYVHVNRTLQSLRQQELIVLRGRTLTVLNVQRLKALAEFNPGYLLPVARAAALQLS